MRWISRPVVESYGDCTKSMETDSYPAAQTEEAATGWGLKSCWGVKEERAGQATPNSLDLVENY